MLAPNKVTARNIAARDEAPVRGSYICDRTQEGCPDFPPRPKAGPFDHCWHESTRRRLAWQYGEARAASIMGGTDDASDRDERAWERLGGV